MRALITGASIGGLTTVLQLDQVILNQRKGMIGRFTKYPDTFHFIHCPLVLCLNNN